MLPRDSNLLEQGPQEGAVAPAETRLYLQGKTHTGKLRQTSRPKERREGPGRLHTRAVPELLHFSDQTLQQI